MSDYGEEPTYPQVINVNDMNIEYKGITKLEHFAGLAMQGIIAGNYDYKEAGKIAYHAFEVAHLMCDEAKRRSKS